MLKIKAVVLLVLMGPAFGLLQQANAGVALVQKTKAPPQETFDGITEMSATYPSPPVSGDLLVAIVSGEISSGPVTPPAGWSTAVNQLFSADVVGNAVFQIPSQAIFYRVAGPLEPQTVAFDYPNDPDANVAVQLYEYSGIDPINPFSGVAFDSGHADTDGAMPGFQVDTGAVAPTTAPALLVAGFAGRPLNASPTVNAGTGNGKFGAYSFGFTEEENMSAGEVPCDDGDPGCYGFSGADRITSALGSYSSTATFTDQKNGTATQGGWRGQIVAFRSIAPTAANATVSGRIIDALGRPLEGAVVRMSGTQERMTITDAGGNYRFDDVETNGFYHLEPARANFAFAPSSRSFSALGSQTEASFTAGMASPADQNPLDTAEFFVRAQYVDFLGREPDEGGLKYWSDRILSCGGDGDCVAGRRVDVSAAFFFSSEFRETGGLVDRLYRASYGRAPLYEEFISDVGAMNGALPFPAGPQNGLAAGSDSFIDGWVKRAAFRARYDALADGDYVDGLIRNSGVNYPVGERDELVNGLLKGSLTRAQVLGQVARSDRFVAARMSEQFILMEYFGYLRRDPDDGGYQFWLSRLNAVSGDSEEREMVRAFLICAEYRERFPR